MTHDFCGTGIRENEGRDSHMEMSTNSKRGPPSIQMLSMLARQVGEHPVRINSPSGSCFMRKELTREHKISTRISGYKDCGGNGVGHVRERNRQSLTRPPNPFISTAPSHFQHHSAMPRLHKTETA